ncbi:MAG: erythromycin esterase family protein [Bacteroidia bacterium]
MKQNECNSKGVEYLKHQNRLLLVFLKFLIIIDEIFLNKSNTKMKFNSFIKPISLNSFTKILFLNSCLFLMFHTNLQAQIAGTSFNNDEIKQLLEAVKNKKIVAIAENVHWIKEYKEDQYNISKLLIDSLGFDAIFIEASNIQVDEIIRKNNFKSYDKIYKMASEMKIPIIGINTAFGEDIRIVIEATKIKDSLFSKQLNEIFILNNTNESLYWFKMALNELEQIKKQVLELTPNNYTLATYPNVINDLIENINFIYQRRTRTDHIRDSFMFAKINNYLIKNPTHKVVVIAHIAHLAKNLKYFTYNLGNQLMKKYGNDYFAISTEFEKGIIYTYTKEKQKMDTSYFKPITHKKTIWNDKKNIALKRLIKVNEISNRKYTTQFIGGQYHKKFSLKKVYYSDLCDLIFTYPVINSTMVK